MILGKPPRQKPCHRQRIDRRPWFGSDAQHLELEGTLPADHRARRRIHPRRVAFQRQAHRGIRTLPLGVGRSTQTERQKSLVDGQRTFAEDFRQPPRRDTAVELHLPQPLARVHHTDDKPGVVVVTGIDRRHAIAVDQHLHRGLQTRKGYLAV
jgi:hypothetical protein